MEEKYICDECYDCCYYWLNNDTGFECNGEEKPCHEFILVKDREMENMDIKEKILLVELLLKDIRGNWGWENDNGVCSRAIMARDLCVEIANELNDNNYSILASCCDGYISDYFECGDGRYFRDTFPNGYEYMDGLHGLKYTYIDKSNEFKSIAKEYLTHPEYRFEDWENRFND